MGTRQARCRQKDLWIPASELPRSAAHPFYLALNQLLDDNGFDSFVEQRCQKFYAPQMGRPSLPPGVYFRCLLIGYFEGLDAERAIAWRIADSISLRRFLAIELDETTPDHSTLSRTRRLIDLETHREVFTWALQLLAREGLLRAKTIAVDATTLEANAATLAGSEAKTETLRARLTAKTVPERSPTNSVPSEANASPQAMPRSLAYTVAEPSGSSRYTTPAKRLETYSRPSGSSARHVGLTTSDENVSRVPSGRTRKIEIGTCWPRVPL